MKTSLNKMEITEYVVNQLNYFFPDKNKVSEKDIKSVIRKVLDRVEFCFKHIETKYYFDGKNAIFNHLNTDHYCVFLYFLSNTLFKENKIHIAEKVFYLNKVLNGIDAFYSLKLPDIFMVVHPLGTILGNAHYENYFVVYQNCTIGSSIEGIYPTFGENVILYSKTSVIGDCKIGNNVAFSANSYIIDKNISNNSIVFGTSPHNIYKEQKKPLINNYFVK